MTSRRFAGTLAAGSVVTALSAGLVASWALFDCVRFQKGPGQCDEAMGAHVPTIVAAAAAVGGALSSWLLGFETLNPALHRRPRRRPRGADGRFLPTGEQ
jgi:membrane associated rhomboid family serine protease